MGSLKAFGLNGFQASLPKKTENLLVKNNIFKVVLQFLEGKGLLEHLKETFLSLISKIDHPEMTTQLRPIGLSNVTYKIITKVIVNRIKPLLPHLIYNTQGSFVPGRQISDNIIIVQEVIHTMRRKQGNRHLMAITIDFEKAYDRLRWSLFLIP